MSKFLKVKRKHFEDFLKICHSSVFKVQINFGICLLGLQKSCANGIRRCINVLFYSHSTPALNPDLLFQTFCSGVKKIHDFCV